jgi:hypothetical protein
MRPVIDVRATTFRSSARWLIDRLLRAEAYVDRASDNSYFPVLFLVTFFGALAFIFLRFG